MMPAFNVRWRWTLRLFSMTSSVVTGIRAFPRDHTDAGQTV
jgi:hypothetical protein